jgi:hypothetical protein
MPESFNTYLNHFTGKDDGTFYYLTLIQENSQFVHNLFHPFHPEKEKSRTTILTYLDSFFSIYVNTFGGNEREDVPKILGRILPASYLKASVNNPGFFQKTREALCASASIVGNGDEKSNAVIPSSAQELLTEINFYNDRRLIKEAADHSQNDQTFITLCLIKTSKGMQVIGGMILEYYSSRANKPDSENPLSHCILTYLFFENEFKKKGIGTYFIREVLPIIAKNQIHIQGRPAAIRPSYVFFEVNNPTYARDARERHEPDDQKSENESDENVDKNILDFFRSVGAKWLDICYVQPKLSRVQGRAYNLLFMILPEVSDQLENAFTISKHDVLTFLTNFYQNHEGNDPRFDITREGLLLDGSKTDVDLYRSFLAIEVADAIDDFENNLIYDKVMELRRIQKDLENQLDFISDVIKDKEPTEQSLITSFLEPVFTYGFESNEKFATYRREFVHTIRTKNILYNAASIDETVEQLVKKEEKLASEKQRIKPLAMIAEKLREIDLSKEDLKIQNNEWFYLKELPRFEAPKLQFDKSSVSFQIALNYFVDAKYFSTNKKAGGADSYQFLIDSRNEKINIDPAKLLHLRTTDNRLMSFDELDCPIFKSYENDLLAFNYYEEKSRTKNKFLTTFSVDITFPYKIEFLSEGRKECVFLNVDADPFAERVDSSEVKYFTYKKRLKGFLNVKCFKNDDVDDLRKKYEQIKIKAGNDYDEAELDTLFDYEVAMAKGLVWNIVFTNDRNEMYKRIALSEYEIIALAKHFSGKQERTFIELEFNEVKAKSKEFQPLLNDIFDIIRSKTKRKKHVLYDIHSGIIQTDTLNTQIFSESAGKFVPLFDSEYRIGGSGSKGKALQQKQNAMRERNSTKRNIMVLLEEYLRDHVDNVELLNQLYRDGDPEEEIEISYMEVYRNARDFHYDDAFTGFEDRYRKNKFLNYFLNALCGVALGIYDFHRMGYEEVTDTIVPLKESANDNTMIIMKRASLFSCCHDNSVFDSSIETIGMSPYLIIPNAVLVYNRVVSDHYIRFQSNMMQLLDEDVNDDEFVRIRREAQKELNFSKNDLYQILLRFRKKTEAHTDGIYIPNIFNYATEQEIYAIGTRDRGIDEIHNKVKSVKAELDEGISEVVEVRNNIYSLLMTIFLGMVSLTSLYEFLHEKVEIHTSVAAMIPKDIPMSGSDIVFYMAFWIFIFYFGSRLIGILPKYILVDLKKRYLLDGAILRLQAGTSHFVSYFANVLGKFFLIPLGILSLTAAFIWLIYSLFVFIIGFIKLLIGG